MAEDEGTDLKIEVTGEDATLLKEIASKQYRHPEQQAAAFVHDALVALRAKPVAPDALVAVSGQPHQGRGKSGPRSVAA